MKHTHSLCVYVLLHLFLSFFFCFRKYVLISNSLVFFSHISHEREIHVISHEYGRVVSCMCSFCSTQKQHYALMMRQIVKKKKISHIAEIGERNAGDLFVL